MQEPDNDHKKWEHPRPYMREPLDLARRLGWTLKRSKRGHIFGLLACPSGQCAERIFSTGKGGESFALDLMNLVRNCPHRPEDIDILAQVRMRIDDLTNWVEGIECAIDHKLVHIELEDILQQIDHAISEVEALTARFEILAESETQSAERTLTLLERLYVDPSTFSFDAMFTTAKRKAREAKKSLDEAGASREETEVLKTEIQKLRGRLTACQRKARRYGLC